MIIKIINKGAEDIINIEQVIQNSSIQEDIKKIKIGENEYI